MTATRQVPSVLSVRTGHTKTNGIGVAENATHTIGANDVDAVCVYQGAGKSSCNVTEGHSPTLETTHDGAPSVAYPVALRGNRTPEARGKFPETDMGDSAYTVTNVHTDSMVAQKLCANGSSHGQRTIEDVSAPVTASGEDHVRGDTKLILEQ